MEAQSSTALITNAPPADVTGITTIIDGLTAAWNKGDFHTFAAHYADDGSFTNIVGMTAFGKPGFEKQHERIFSTIYKGSQVSFVADRIHLVRPDVAIVDVTSKLAGVARFPPGMQPDKDGVLTTKLMMVMTRAAGEWQINAFHNVAMMPVAPQP